MHVQCLFCRDLISFPKRMKVPVPENNCYDNALNVFSYFLKNI